MREYEEDGWLIPAIAVLLPVAILLVGWVMNILGLNGQMVLPVFWVTFVIAPFIGLLTLMILFIQGNLNLNALKQRIIRRAAGFGILGVISPVILIPLMLILINPHS
jgi:ABC-type uncharacterized transport system permease subunit